MGYCYRSTSIYDALSQFTIIGYNKIVTTTYTYDDAGNRLSLRSAGVTTTYSIGSMNQVLTALDTAGHRTTLVYNAEGMPTQLRTTSGITTYSWDFEGRLHTVLDASGLTTYTYSGDGQRRIRETPTTKRLYVWDGVDLLQDWSATGPSLGAHFTLMPDMWTVPGCWCRSGVPG